MKIHTLSVTLIASLLASEARTQTLPAAVPSSQPATRAEVERARSLLHQGQAEAALALLEPTLEKSAAGVAVNLPALVEADGVAATVLARAAQGAGRIDLALPLFQALYQRAAAAGDGAVAARLAIRMGDVLLVSAHPAEAAGWYQRAQADDVMLRATLGLAQSLRRAGQPAQALEAIERTGPRGLPLTDVLRAPLLAEAARDARGAGQPDLGITMLAELWASHPADVLTVPGFPVDEDPFLGADLAAIQRRAGPLGAVIRAERLLEASQLEQALQASRAVKTDEATLSCRAGYVEGKSLRNLRRHSQAARVLEPLSRRCPEQAPRALYLLGMVSGFRGQNAQALAAYDRFAENFPAHEYTDDVLFFSGDVLSRQGRHAEAERFYQKVVDQHPTGDYAPEARWRLAWGAFLDGKQALARDRLDAIARAEAGAPDSRPYQQAVYWRARLGLAGGQITRPDGERAVSGAGPADAVARDEREAAIDDLEGLLRADPTSYYGVLARTLLHRQVPERAANLDRWMVEQAVQVQQAASQVASIVVPDLAAARLGHALVQAALDEEAVELLNTIDGSSLDMPGVLAVAEDLRRAGDTHAAHWLVRKRAERELVGRPDPADAALWHAGYPRGYSDAVSRWAQSRSLDENLVYGLIREESAFDAPVVSWAGAVGLMQLMPSTARDEAALDRVADFKVERLTEPDLNVRLGSAHIARRIRTFDGNPALAIAAYNAGPNAVKKWMAASPTADLDVSIENIPIEQTRGYTKRVLRSWSVYRFLYTPDAPFVDLPATAR
ncbi:MAG: transglycosylase SLT domain-containing protein [Pseudomonadota bacterium]